MKQRLNRMRREMYSVWETPSIDILQIMDSGQIRAFKTLTTWPGKSHMSIVAGQEEACLTRTTMSDNL